MSIRRFALSALVVILLVFVVAILLPQPANPAQPVSTPRPTFVATPYQRLPTATPTVPGRILAAIGETDRAGAIRPIIKDEEQVLAVVFSMDDSLTASLMRRYTLATIVDIARIVRDHTANTRELRIAVSGPITDAYGNTTEQHVLSVYLKPATLDKINFAAFDVDNLPVVADYYWQHQAMPK